VEEHWEHGLLGCPEIAHNLARSNIDNIVDCVDHPRVQSDDLREEGVRDGLGERICQTRALALGKEKQLGVSVPVS
jgi:hypothetical protein